MGAGNEVRLQVQICTLGREGMRRLIAAGHPRVEGVEWLVSWQLPEDSCPVPDILLERSDFRVIVSRDRGLSRNRNHALDATGAPYILIGDDDVDYTPAGLRQLLSAFESRPDLDVICCRYTCRGQYVKPYGNGEFSLLSPPRGWYPTSFEIALRAGKLRGLRFNENLGLGAPVCNCGEEDVLLATLLRTGAEGVGLPILIGAHNTPTTGEKLACDARFIFTHGAVMTWLHPRTWPLRLLAHARRSPLPFLRYLRHSLRGALHACRTSLFAPEKRILYGAGASAVGDGQGQE